MCASFAGGTAGRGKDGRTVAASRRMPAIIANAGLVHTRHAHARGRATVAIEGTDREH